MPTLAGRLGILPTGETFVVPADPQPVPEPASAEAPVGVGPEKAVEQVPGKATKDVADLGPGDTVFVKQKPMVVAWVSSDRVRTILLTPENAERSMKEKGFLHGKQYGGVTVGMRDVTVTAASEEEIRAVEDATNERLRERMSRELPERLMTHQREGAQWLLQQGSGLCAFEQGLGKTATAIVAADYPAIVVCPKSLKENWVREISMWRPDLTAAKIETGKSREAASLKAALSADVCVVNYDIIGRYLDEFKARGFKTLIVDESHYIKTLRIGPKQDPKTKRWKTVATGAARAVSVYEISKSTPRRLLLSGTPMDNKSPCELWGQLHIVSPDDFPKFKPFGEAYCDPQPIPGRSGMSYEGASNILELHERIDGKYMLRKNKDILDLPEKWRQTTFISLDDETAKEYHQAAIDLFRYVEKRGGWEALERAQKAEVLVRLATLSRLCGIGKVEAFVEQVEQHWESTHRPLLIFAQHVEVQEAILAALKQLHYRVGAIGGGMSERARQDVVDRFQRGVPETAPPEEREYYDILVLSLSAAREGLTLTRAQDVYFVERTWSPYHLLQAEDRSHRIGQQNKVIVTYFDAPGTIDEKLGAMLMKKLAIGAGVLEGIGMTQEEAASGIFGAAIESMVANAGSAATMHPDWVEPE